MAELRVNFSLKYAETEDKTFFCDSYSADLIKNGRFDGDIASENASSILSPMMFSRHTSMDSITTISSASLTVQSDYSCYISSNVSPSDIPDSPSDVMPEFSRSSYFDHRQTMECERCVEDDEQKLLENCLRLGMNAMLHPNYQHESVTTSQEDTSNDFVDNENDLLDECWRNGVKTFIRNQRI
ncbi:hypothetical protein Bhyg_06008 [Pseudolycoriella hygida]|uniref:Uncharacterized protein n=1 Tax=Pseudolycoriella hygida TaxID=35572 RepID=A0A9Q0N010_9DIPT|nr:hypothetical protein Bhyg_06008 [Pseudolycoriella hygida]